LPELVAEHGYEGAVALLWEGFAGSGLDRARIRAELGAAREAAFARRGGRLDAAAHRPLTEGMRLSLAALPEESTPAAILGFLPVAIACLLRVQQSRDPVAPDAALGSADDLLRMIRGAPADERMAGALDAYWTSVIDNGLNASAYAARIIASTRARWRRPPSVPIAPLPGDCMAALADRPSICSTKPRRAATSRAGSRASSRPASV
jgi:citrate synthase